MSGRKFIERSSKEVEEIVEESLKIVGIETTKDKAKLLARLVISGIANHYFKNPDDLIRMGFLQFEKSPNKDELFKVMIIRDKETGVVNAETLWRYYKGELRQEAQFKQILDNFLKELIEYSQAQEIDITQLTSQIQTKKGK